MYQTCPCNFSSLDRAPKKLTVNQMFDASPTPGAPVLDEKCPAGLEKGQIVFLGKDIGFYAEKPLPEGTKVVFTRYMWDRATSLSGIFYPIHKRAFFRFPDGSERSLTKDSFTRRHPRSIMSRVSRIMQFLKRAR